MPIFLKNTSLQIFAFLQNFLAPLVLAGLLWLHGSFSQYRDVWFGNVSRNKVSMRNVFSEGHTQTLYYPQKHFQDRSLTWGVPTAVCNIQCSAFWGRGVAYAKVLVPAARGAW